MAEADETDREALRRLEERLERAAATAERLLADATSAAVPRGVHDVRVSEDGARETPPRTPPAGWQRRTPADGGSDPRTDSGSGPATGPGPGSDSGPGSGSGSGEIDLLLGILAALRHRIPPELQQRLTDAVHEVLLAVRALIDWYLERSEGQRPEPSPVQDIPIL